jgi:hypothetical protein
MVAIMVRRQVLDVDVRGTESDGLQLQRRLPALCGDVVPAALEAALGRFDSGEEHLIIDLLDVDLGEIPIDRFEAELATALRREVELHLVRAGPADGHDDAASPHQASVPARRSAQEAVDGALVWFLRTGRLPWSFRLPPGVPFERVVLESWARHGGGQPPAATLTALANVLRGPEARTRLGHQFSPQFAVDVLRGLSPTVALASGEVMAALDPVLLTEPVRREFARAVWEAALLAAAFGEDPATEQLARRAWRASAKSELGDAVLGVVLERHWPGILAAQPPADAEASAPLARRDAGDPAEAVGEGILVEHAGLVLLHPFLPRLFSALGVAMEDELLDPGRALCLLDHLVTGELVAPEHRLTVAKVLCDVPLDSPVAADVGLTAAEVQEATGLLESVIGHWAALGHASPEALRGEFLAREGVLAIDADGDWLLRVEGRTIDILLDRLPWGVSLIRLPWMSRMLKVQWR